MEYSACCECGTKKKSLVFQNGRQLNRYIELSQELEGIYVCMCVIRDICRR